jgi:hypothetical protein
VNKKKNMNTAKGKKKIIGPLVKDEAAEEEVAYSRPSVSHVKNKDKNT